MSSCFMIPKSSEYHFCDKFTKTNEHLPNIDLVNPILSGQLQFTINFEPINPSKFDKKTVVQFRSELGSNRPSETGLTQSM